MTKTHPCRKTWPYHFEPCVRHADGIHRCRLRAGHRIPNGGWTLEHPAHLCACGHTFPPDGWMH